MVFFSDEVNVVDVAHSLDGDLKPEVLDGSATLTVERKSKEVDKLVSR